jgi:hypothetical protein
MPEQRVASVTDAVVTALRSIREAAQPQPETVEQPEGEKAKAASFKAIGVDEFGVIVGIGGAAGSPEHLDLDGEFLEKGDLIKMAFDFCASPSRQFKANHQDALDAQLVESWVGTPIIEDGKGVRELKAGERLVNGMKVVGIGLDVTKASHWFVGVKPTDPSIVKAAKDGAVAGFSWGADVNKVLA